MPNSNDQDSITKPKPSIAEALFLGTFIVIVILAMAFGVWIVNGLIFL